MNDRSFLSEAQLKKKAILVPGLVPVRPSRGKIELALPLCNSCRPRLRREGVSPSGGPERSSSLVRMRRNRMEVYKAFWIEAAHRLPNAALDTSAVGCTATHSASRSTSPARSTSLQAG
jgi:hypothetical protein